MGEATFDRSIGTTDDLMPDGARHVTPASPHAPARDPGLPLPGVSVSGGRIGPGDGAMGSSAAVPRGVGIGSQLRPELSPFQRSFRHWFSRTVSSLLIKTWFRVTIVGRDRIRPEPALYVFNHLSWMDPLLLLATFPASVHLHFYGPKEVDLQRGARNRFMWWTTIPVPFSPHKDDLLTSVRRAQAVFNSGASLAISAEGRIHVHEGDLLPFEEGAAYLALRAGVPIVPVAITGTSWAHFRGRVLVRIGEPIPTGERPTRQVVARYTAITWHRLRAMVADDRDPPIPGPIGRWMTDLLNDWGPGGRPAATNLRGPDPADVPIPQAEPPRSR